MPAPDRVPPVARRDDRLGGAAGRGGRGLAFPIAAAVALAALAGAVVGAALHRRYPSAVGRTLRLPADDASIRET
ncbi:hypothetical protein PM023_08380 [Halorubrum ezzemoulense]|uniref:hypothetical protein n=1 Tax=Halorubrum ezzemoulense TaxID=337243 RepID=UPI00232F9270|nr:hypothetical protein [Halorubrum ezzemoulense]MDB2224685.1 hypothetical protein [Halorubrum ezzemoulense]